MARIGLVAVVLVFVVVSAGVQVQAAHDPFCICLPFVGCFCIPRPLTESLSGGSDAVVDVRNEVVGGLAWCVPRASASDSVLQQLIDYSCSQGADCFAILPGGSCYPPNTLYAHASFALNSYWQNMRAKGATCDFQGAAMLVTQDPSNGQCNYPSGPAPDFSPSPASASH